MATTRSRPDTLGALAACLGTSVPGDGARAIQGLADDSRDVQPGDVFFARSGSETTGLRFVQDAVARGAVAVVAEGSVDVDVPHLAVPDAAAALRDAADAWFDRPQDHVALVGITGTKGKTTCAWITAAALRASGIPAGVLGTIAHDVGAGPQVPARNTTPGALELRRLLAQARARDLQAMAMEVSSHALDQDRVVGLPFRVAVFTNLASDHLDYHRTPKAYRDAKARLFRGLATDATAVLNGEDPAWTEMAAGCKGRVWTYGTTPESDLRALDVRLSVTESRFTLRTGDGLEMDARTRLIGRHNVRNLLAAVGAAMALGVDPVPALEGACALAGVPGRLQRVGSGDLVHAFVDYAHTEDALVQVLGFLRGVGAQPLTCVVGCGGDRDATKRAPMARVAAELADRVVFTSDNPRGEDPHAILRDMRAGLPASGSRAEVVEIVDRRAAIAHAIAEAPLGSTVLVAGKGHEQVQIVGDERRPFDDVAEVERALALRGDGVAPRHD